MGDIHRLIDGFNRFQKQYFVAQPEHYRELKEGQSPSTLIIGCGDSRVDPAILLDSDPGEFFTVRNVASLVPPPNDDVGPQGVLAAIQYAVVHLKVGRIIVLGHSQCGGIHALMTGRELSYEQAVEKKLGYVHSWMRIAGPAREKVLRQYPDASLPEQLCACEKEAVLLSLKNLALIDDVRERVEAQNLAVYGWYFDMARGSLWAYSERADDFLPVVPPSDMSP